MIKVCAYPECQRKALYLMGWQNKNGRHFGIVCSTHDRVLGRINLCNTGFTVQDTILFERYLSETVDSLVDYADFPKWLELEGKAPLTRRSHYFGTASVEILGLSNRTWNALRRYGITTLQKLSTTSDIELMHVRTLGREGLREIHERLEEFTDEQDRLQQTPS